MWSDLYGLVNLYGLLRAASSTGAIILIENDTWAIGAVLWWGQVHGRMRNSTMEPLQAACRMTVGPSVSSLVHSRECCRPLKPLHQPEPRWPMVSPTSLNPSPPSSASPPTRHSSTDSTD